MLSSSASLLEAAAHSTKIEMLKIASTAQLGLEPSRLPSPFFLHQFNFARCPSSFVIILSFSCSFRCLVVPSRCFIRSALPSSLSSNSTRRSGPRSSSGISSSSSLSTSLLHSFFFTRALLRIPSSPLFSSYSSFFCLGLVGQLVVFDVLLPARMSGVLTLLDIPLTARIPFSH